MMFCIWSFFWRLRKCCHLLSWSRSGDRRFLTRSSVSGRCCVICTLFLEILILVISLCKRILKKKIRKEFFLLKNLTFHNLDSVRKRLSVIIFFQGLHGLKKPCQAQLWLIFIISNYFQNRHFSTHLTQNYTATVDDMGKKRLKNKKN